MGVSADVSLGGKGGSSLSEREILGDLLVDAPLGGGSSGRAESLSGRAGRGCPLLLFATRGGFVFLEGVATEVATTPGVEGSGLSWIRLACLGEEGGSVGTVMLRVFSTTGLSHTDCPVVGL